MKPERRDFTIPAARAILERGRDGQPTKIVGYGAVYYDPAVPGTEYRLWSDTYERIAPGAFDRALKEDDVRSLFNHDANVVLGRTSADPPTLSLISDRVGLRYEVEPPDTQLVRDQVLTPIGRGDVSGSSFMFYPRKVAWLEEDRAGRQIEIREIQEIELLEVGPVTFPAYEATTTGVRAAGDIDHIRAEYLEHRRQRPNWDESEAEAVMVRLRMLELGQS